MTMKLTVTVTGLRFRATDRGLTPTAQLELLKKRLENNSPLRIREGDPPNKMFAIAAQRRPECLEIEELTERKEFLLCLNLSGGEVIEIQMIRISPQISVMKGVVSIGLFQKVMGDVVNSLSGSKIGCLLKQFNSPRKNERIGYINIGDAQLFTEKLNILTGKEFRFPWVIELEQVTNQLSNNQGNNWAWAINGDGTYVPCNGSDPLWHKANPNLRVRYYSIRLVLIND